MKVVILLLCSRVVAAIPGWFRQKAMPRGGGVGPESLETRRQLTEDALLHNNDAHVDETKDVLSDENRVINTKLFPRQRHDDSGDYDEHHFLIDWEGFE